MIKERTCPRLEASNLLWLDRSMYEALATFNLEQLAVLSAVDVSPSVLHPHKV